MQRRHCVRMASLALGSVLLLGCQPPPSETPVAEAAQPAASSSNSWLQGTVDDRFDEVANQLRGLDMAMVEIGYRYQELYWAGQNRNWAYARYQTDKIRQSLANALVRRPRREPSAREIFIPALDKMTSAVTSQDPAQLMTAFDELTGACNSCHVAESVSSFVVMPPEVRTSPIR